MAHRDRPECRIPVTEAPERPGRASRKASDDDEEVADGARQPAQRQLGQAGGVPGARCDRRRFRRFGTRQQRHRQRPPARAGVELRSPIGRHGEPPAFLLVERQLTGTDGHGPPHRLDPQQRLGHRCPAAQHQAAAGRKGRDRGAHDGIEDVRGQ